MTMSVPASPANALPPTNESVTEVNCLLLGPRSGHVRCQTPGSAVEAHTALDTSVSDAGLAVSQSSVGGSSVAAPPEVDGRGRRGSRTPMSGGGSPQLLRSS